MSYTLKIRLIAVISSSVIRDLELAGIRMKVQNRMKSLERKKYTNAGFVATTYRFALYGLLEGIISNHTLRKTTKLKKATITFQL
jgi:hypothetical protein